MDPPPNGRLKVSLGGDTVDSLLDSLRSTLRGLGETDHINIWLRVRRDSRFLL